MEGMSRRDADRVFGALRQRQRRLVLLGLSAGEIESEDDLPGPDGSREAVELVHEHLPKLEAFGYVRWDRETGAISRGPAFGEIEPVIELIEGDAPDLLPDRT